jgi:hypothetical protein
MIPTIRFKGWITFEDALRVERLLIPQKIWSVTGVTTIALMVAIGITGMSISTQTSLPYAILFLVFLVIAGGFIGGLFWLMQKFSLKAKRKHYDRNLIERSGTLNADKITVATNKTMTEIQWDLFDKIITTENLVLVAKDKEYMAFAPYMFSSKQEWDACQALVNGRKEKSQPSAPIHI